MEVEGDRAFKMGFTFGIGLGAGNEFPVTEAKSRETWEYLEEGAPMGLAG